MSQLPLELINSVRWIVEDLVPRDAGVAAQAFDELVASYGRIACGSALRRVVRESGDEALV